jgi:hypothetical protein
VAAFSRGRMIDANFRRHAERLGITIEKNRRIDLTGFPVERARLEDAVPTIILTTACIVGFGWMLQEKVHLSGPLIMLFFYRILRVGVSELHRGALPGLVSR